MRRACDNLVLLGFAVSVWLVAACHAAEPRGPVRILFAGSSSTYMHNMPNQVAQWLQRHGGYKDVRAHLIGKSGTGVHVYLRPDFKVQYGLDRDETILENIVREKYDYLVLQMVTDFIAGDEGDEFDRAVDTYCKAIRAAGGEPVFYEMGWGRDELNDQGQQRVFQAAVRNKVHGFAPCSTAWERVREMKPELELHNLPDTVHPGTMGHYLNLCCFYAAMTGKSPEGLPATVVAWPRFGSFDKAEADRRLEHVELDAYEAVLPGFMKRMTAMQTEVRLNDETAELLQQIAWKTWQHVQERLAMNGVHSRFSG